MKKIIAVILGVGLLITSCESEEIAIVETTTTHITGVPVGGGITEAGDDSFLSFIDGVEFVNGISNITNESDVLLTIYAYDDAGENGFQIWLPLSTMTEGDHVLTNPGTAGYGLTCLEDGSAFYPSADVGNRITIIEYDDVANYVKAEFTLNMVIDGGGTFLDNVTGEFEVNY